MDPATLSTTCVMGAVGAVGLYLLLRPGTRAMKVTGIVLGLAAAAWLLVRLPTALGSKSGHTPEAFFVIFSLIAVASAVRMITHRRPVYAALYFIMVVLSSAGLFLLLEAEFMAFALIIVYAGAILVTYVFVLMLAQQEASPDELSGQPEYDVIAREPAAATLVGFVMIALLSTMILQERQLPDPPAKTEVFNQRWRQLELMPEKLKEEVLLQAPDFSWPPPTQSNGRLITVRSDGSALVKGTIVSGEAVTVDLPASALPLNVQTVGLELVAKFPVSLELAGVILLLAMFGAVVLARKQIELSEDEVRAAAGLPRFGLEDEGDGGEDRR